MSTKALFLRVLLSFYLYRFFFCQNKDYEELRKIKINFKWEYLFVNVKVNFYSSKCYALFKLKFLLWFFLDRIVWDRKQGEQRSRHGRGSDAHLPFSRGWNRENFAQIFRAQARIPSTSSRTSRQRGLEISATFGIGDFARFRSRARAASKSDRSENRAPDPLLRLSAPSARRLRGGALSSSSADSQDQATG